MQIIPNHSIEEVPALLHPRPVKKVKFEQIQFLVRENVKFYSENITLKRKNFNPKPHMSAMVPETNPDKSNKRKLLMKEKTAKLGLNLSRPEAAEETQSSTKPGFQDSVEQSTRSAISITESPIPLKAKNVAGPGDEDADPQEEVLLGFGLTAETVKRCSNPMRIPPSKFLIPTDADADCQIEESSQDETDITP